MIHDNFLMQSLEFIRIQIIKQTSQFNIPNPPSTTIRTNPHFHNTSTTSLTNISNIPTYNTTPPSTISHNTMSHPTYINTSTSISEPIKPFDGLDHNYTPEGIYNILKHVLHFP